MTESRSRPLRAVLRNAVAWGVAWAAIGGALVAGVALFDADPRVESLPERVGLALGVGMMWGVRFGVIGAAMGTVFAGAIRLRYRGRRLAEISPLRFGLLGAAVGGVGVPLFLQTMNVLSGDGPIAWGLVTDDAAWATVFGGVAAAGSILLARRADETGRGARRAALDGADEPAALRAAGPSESPLPQRSHAVSR